MTKTERDLLLHVADWLVVSIARQGCVPILLATEDSRVRT
jgi:hypothetical protein